MADPLLKVDHVSQHFGGLLAVNAAAFEVEPQSITALIGPNGAGKTTLFAIIAGFLNPSEGRIYFAERDITGVEPHRLARLGLVRPFPIVPPFSNMTGRDNNAVGAHLP